MAKATIKSTKGNLERGEAIRRAAGIGHDMRMHMRISELDREFLRMEEHLQEVTSRAHKKPSNQKA